MREARLVVPTGRSHADPYYLAMAREFRKPPDHEHGEGYAREVAARASERTARRAILKLSAKAPSGVTPRTDKDTIVLSCEPIPPEARATLFDPIARGVTQQAERLEGASGLGLGLYIARELCAANGADFRITWQGVRG